MQQNNDTICRNKFRVPRSRPKISKGDPGAEIPEINSPTSQPSVLSCMGTKNCYMVPNQENMEGDQPVQSHSHAQQPLQSQTRCAGISSGWNRTPFFSFPGRLRNISSTTFQSPELLIECGFIWKETMQLVSGQVEFIACPFNCCGTTPP